MPIQWSDYITYNGRQVTQYVIACTELIGYLITDSKGHVMNL